MKKFRYCSLLVTLLILAFGPCALANTNPRGCNWWDEYNCKKKVAAPEGGNNALYLLLGGGSCLAAIMAASRKRNLGKAV